MKKFGALFALVSVAFLSACSGGSDKAPDIPPLVVKDYEKMIEEFEQRLTEVELPEGTHITPPEHPGWFFDDDGKLATTSYVEGVGVSIVQSGFFCLWIGDLIHRDTSDKEGIEHALDQLQEHNEFPMNDLIYDSFTQQYNKEIVSKALLGDFGPARYDFNLNCSGVADQFSNP